MSEVSIHKRTLHDPSYEESKLPKAKFNPELVRSARIERNSQAKKVGGLPSQASFRAAIDFKFVHDRVWRGRFSVPYS
jgi:hypothetical protein